MSAKSGSWVLDYAPVSPMARRKTYNLGDRLRKTSVPYVAFMAGRKLRPIYAFAVPGAVERQLPCLA